MSGREWRETYRAHIQADNSLSNQLKGEKEKCYSQHLMASLASVKGICDLCSLSKQVPPLKRKRIKINIFWLTGSQEQNSNVLLRAACRINCARETRGTGGATLHLGVPSPSSQRGLGRWDSWADLRPSEWGWKCSSSGKGDASHKEEHFLPPSLHCWTAGKETKSNPVTWNSRKREEKKLSLLHNKVILLHY